MVQSSRKRFFFIGLSFLALFVTSWLELYLQRKQHLIGAGLNRTSLFLLINIHVIAIVGLLTIIIRQSIKLFIERRKEAPGSIFKRNLLFAFTFFSVIPSFFIFFTAGKFITTSIDDWFHARIGTGLQNSITLHQIHTAQIRKTLDNHGTLLVQKLAPVLLDPVLLDLDTTQSFTQNNSNIIASIQNNPSIKSFSDNYTLYIWDKDLHPVIGSIKNEISVWRSYRRFNDRSMQTLKQKFIAHIAQASQESHESHESKESHIFDFYGSLYCAHTINNYIIILVHRYPEPIRYPLIEIENSANDYQQLKSMRNPIYLNYIFTFILVTLLILFLSIWCAFYLARGISNPIQELLKATEKMRNGQFDIQIPYDESNDLKSLAQGFNEMSAALKEANKQQESKNKELDAIIENLTVAVFFVSKFGRIIAFNTAAKELVLYYLDRERFKNKKINFFGKEVQSQFFILVRELRATKTNKLQKEISFIFNGEARTLMIHSANIPITTGQSTSEQRVLIAIEDISAMVKANKLKTWQEAAKQMAHEIKNPLTPIQLATQRLQRKYNKILEADTTFLNCTNTILSHVKIIQDLATHFYEFAAMPAPHIEPTHLTELIQETISLYELSYPNINFIYDFDPEDFKKPFLTDKKKFKRVIINLLDNSIRAINKELEEYKPEGHNEKKYVKIETNIVQNPEYTTGILHIIFSDNGPGIAKSVKDTLFLPYVSSEKKNMGLGLAIVHDIITQLKGSISLTPSHQGAIFFIALPLLSEEK